MLVVWLGRRTRGIVSDLLCWLDRALEGCSSSARAAFCGGSAFSSTLCCLCDGNPRVGHPCGKSPRDFQPESCSCHKLALYQAFPGVNVCRSHNRRQSLRLHNFGVEFWIMSKFSSHEQPHKFCSVIIPRMWFQTTATVLLICEGCGIF